MATMLGVILALSTCCVPADPYVVSSERPIDPRTFEDILRARLREMRTPQLPDNAQLQKILEHLLRMDLTSFDPKTRKALLEMADQMRNGMRPNLENPELLEALRKLPLNEFDRTVMTPELERWLNDLIGRKPLLEPPLDPDPIVPREPRMPFPRESPPEDHGFRSWLLNQLRDLERGGSSLASSEAFRNFLNELARSPGSAASWTWPNVVLRNWGPFGGRFAEMLRGPWPRFGMGQPVEVGMPEVSTAVGGMGKALLPWLVVVALVVLWVWWLANRKVSLAGLGALSARRFALDPHVVDRQQFIHAFEVLSLLRLGDQVRTWNHRRIADGLAALPDVDAAAVRRLADLYEQARYAPESGPWTEQDFAQARHDLTLFAERGRS